MSEIRGTKYVKISATGGGSTPVFTGAGKLYGIIINDFDSSSISFTEPDGSPIFGWALSASSPKVLSFPVALECINGLTFTYSGTSVDITILYRQ